MKKLIECVPNISEGRDKAIIDAIVNSIKNVSGIDVLDVDPGFDTNRTVITFVGDIHSVEEAAFQCVKKSFELIDMSRHKGAHPRQGCTDVCPFVPLDGSTMDDCVALARRTGKRIGTELKLPVYLYGYSSSTNERSDLSYLRKGEYESLAEKLPSMIPDFGPTCFDQNVKKGGAIQVGARDFLIAYNVNINSRDKSLANEIAFRVREAGHSKKDDRGNIIKDANGNPIKIPGRLKAVKGIGWYIDQYNIAQVSINLINYHTTPLHAVFEACREEAEKLGLRATGSELVGLIPKEAMLQAGRFYLTRAKRSSGVPEKELIHIAVKSLGLDELSDFDVNSKIIEYRIEKSAKLRNMKLCDFIDEVGKDSPAPGGGSVAALAGSLGAGLGTMVAALTPAKKGFEDTLIKMDEKGHRLGIYMEDLKKAVDLDTDAFNDVISAMRMPKKTEEEIKARDAALENGYKKATQIPYNTAKACVDILENLVTVAELGNPSSISDVGVGALVAHAGFEGAVLNVKINLPSIKDDHFVNEMRTNISTLRSKAEQSKNKIMRTIDEKIGK